jgi:DNA mismatch endonuclease (patch repair protein)
LAVFVDGCFWHGCPQCGHVPKTRSPFWEAKFQRNRMRDARNARKLRQLGVCVIRVWEHSLKTPVGRHRVLARIQAKRIP